MAKHDSGGSPPGAAGVVNKLTVTAALTRDRDRDRDRDSDSDSDLTVNVALTVSNQIHIPIKDMIL